MDPSTRGISRKAVRAVAFLILAIPLSSFAVDDTGTDKVKVPILWCGIEGAPSMVNPGAVNESTTDNVLWRRHERPTDAIYEDAVNVTFRSGATAAIKNGPLSFPIILDPSGSNGDVTGFGEAGDAWGLCKRAWDLGDTLYLDANNNGIVNSGTDSLLSTDIAAAGTIELGQNGASLVAAPADVRYVDANLSGDFDLLDRLYRDENTNGLVDAGTDTLLGPGTLATVVGDTDPADAGAALLAVPGQVKYVDLIREPPNTYNIGYDAVRGITAVSVNDFEVPSIAFPVHGVGGGAEVLMDDPSQYLPPGPDYTLFETQLVGHEFGHALGLPHGDGIDDDTDCSLDESDEGDPAAPFPGAGAGTLCDQDNLMQYCWQDLGTSGNPTMNWIGVGAPAPGSLTEIQGDVVRATAEVLLAPASGEFEGLPSQSAAERTDAIGDVPPPFPDITDLIVDVDNPGLAELELRTRRPFPNFVGPLEFVFIVDADGSLSTGGRPAGIRGESIPTDFDGADYVVRVLLDDGEIVDVALFLFDDAIGAFVRLPDGIARAIRRTAERFIDFPNSFFTTSNPPSLVDTRVAEEITVSILTPAIPAFNPPFRVEYLARDLQMNVVDRARTRGMNFAPAAFPDCATTPQIVSPGDTTNVVATGLLPDRKVHAFVGDDEAGNGATDGNGDTVLEITVPADSPTGDRLVTVGALAVTADCFVTVEDQLGGTPAGRIPNGATIPGTPLRLAKQALGDITLTWEESCAANDRDFEVYEGLLGVFESHTARFCETEGLTTKTFRPADASSYYLVVPRGSGREGSYGTDSSGAERPQGITACLEQDIVDCATCPHDSCTTGEALDPICGSCVATICDVDAFCCNNEWDDLCVSRVLSVCNCLDCDVSSGNCAHDICEPGEVLARECDAADPSCTTRICEVDPFCCETEWDSICVGRVSTVCGLSCDCSELKPDLVPVPSAAGFFCRISGSSLEVVVRNQGSISAPASTARVSFGAAGVVLVPIPALAPGQEATGLAAFPPGCFVPDCFFEIQVDVNDVVDESNETNNTVTDFCLG